MLADLDPELAPPADRVRPLGDGRYELKAVIDADCQQGLEHLRGLLSHVDPRMTMGQLVGRIVQEALDRHDPSRPPRRARTGSGASQGESEPAPAAKEQTAPEPGHAVTVQDAAIPAGPTPTAEQARHPTPTSVPSPTRREATERQAVAGTKPAGAATSTAKPCPSGRAIPAAVRRQVWQRDGGRCSYIDRQTGRRCNSRHRIEIDHILPYALGGGADPGNLRLLCGAHHRRRHAPHG
ncbi:MAG: HNH endonuclease [Spirochaetaceae bacterium]|nr:HNH endonuclease [Spirochaetaceae bacterium]